MENLDSTYQLTQKGYEILVAPLLEAEEDVDGQSDPSLPETDHQPIIDEDDPGSDETSESEPKQNNPFSLELGVLAEYVKQGCAVVSATMKYKQGYVVSVTVRQGENSEDEDQDDDWSDPSPRADYRQRLIDEDEAVTERVAHLAELQASPEFADICTLQEFRALGLPGPDASLDDQVTCWAAMRRSGLNPLMGHIYFARSEIRGGPLDPVKVRWEPRITLLGLQGIAETSGIRSDEDMPEWCDSNGEWRDHWNQNSPPVACRVSVNLRRAEGQIDTYHGMAHFDEICPRVWDSKRKAYRTPEAWLKMPATMLAKCAKMAALKAAYPQYSFSAGGQEEASETAWDLDPSPADPGQIRIKIDLAAFNNAKTEIDKFRSTLQSLGDTDEPPADTAGEPSKGALCPDLMPQPESPLGQAPVSEPVATGSRQSERRGWRSDALGDAGKVASL